MIKKKEINEIEFFHQKPQWELSFGSIDNQIENSTCAVCDRKIKDNEIIDYVACNNGVVVWWHRCNCRTKK